MNPKVEQLPIELSSGNCKELGIDVQLMYPEMGDERGEAAAKAVCVNCSAESVCLNWALKRREAHGVWGGKTEDERRLIGNKIRRVRHGHH